MAWRLLGVLCVLPFLPLLAPAQPSAPQDAVANLTQLLQPLLVDSLPPVLYEGQHNWGKQALVSEIHFKGLRPIIEKVPRNDGTWRKYKVTTRNLPKTFKVELPHIAVQDAEIQLQHFFSEG